MPFMVGRQRGRGEAAAPVCRTMDRDADHCQLVLGNIFLTYSVGTATQRNIESMVKNLELFFSQLQEGDRGVYVLVTKGTAKPPPASTRAVVARVFSEHAQKLAALAVVIEVPGFAGAALRAVASTLFVLAQRKVPVRFFGEGAASAAWVSEKADAPPDSMDRLLKQAYTFVGR
jgi:hypothetical protein